ncbi:hypothetical protein SAY86_007492 [Trapa natans]|uniref:Transmembrane protein n=1 Tax=Trapa natans TaxID=22666 RepID=A0AAN7L8E9_TRANT|nr:hypothetical protein SAY86_007492 [Trapa natans]
MEPPRGVLSSVWNFIRFLPYFIGLLLLGTIKGIIFCPMVCLIMTLGNSAALLGLWPVHCVWTYYSVFRSKQLGPVLKLALFICIPIPLVLWPVLGIVGSMVGGAAYGFLSPIFATFDAIGTGKSDELIHCLYDGTWSTVKGCFTIIRDFSDVCFHSYFSYMDELQGESPNRKYEIRLLHLPGAVIAGVLGFLIDMPTISLIALYKSPYMLFKGWNRLLHDLIGREGPFLETICVPFAGLAIILWPLAVVGAVLGSMVSSIFLGAYAGIIVYQESSFWMGLQYIVASVSIYDEYSNDVLDMKEGSCFPRPRYRKNDGDAPTPSREGSFSKHGSFSKKPPVRAPSFKNVFLELNPLEFLDGLFEECQCHGEKLVSEGLITPQDIEDAKSSKSSRVISIGLPAYCFLRSLLHSIKANSAGILLGEGDTEVISTNKPVDTLFIWILNPLLIIKEQIKAMNLTVAEEDYFCKLVLLSDDNTDRLKHSFMGTLPEPEIKRAELSALARRLRGIVRSASRFPTFKRRYDALVRILSEELAKKKGGTDSANGCKPLPRSKSALIVRIFSQKSFKKEKSNDGSGVESQQIMRDVEIE